MVYGQSRVSSKWPLCSKVYSRDQIPCFVGRVSSPLLISHHISSGWGSSWPLLSQFKMAPLLLTHQKLFRWDGSQLQQSPFKMVPVCKCTHLESGIDGILKFLKIVPMLVLVQAPVQLRGSCFWPRCYHSNRDMVLWC